MKAGCCAGIENYREVRSLGYDYIELSARRLMLLPDAEFEEFLAEYRETGFPCLGFNDFCGADVMLVGPAVDRGRRSDYLAKALERGAQLGIQNVGIGAPFARTLPEGFDGKQADDQMLEFLEEACRQANPLGIRILMEAVHSGMCNYATCTHEATALVKQLREPNLGMVYDIYHAEYMGEDVSEFEEALPFVRHMHYSTQLEGNNRGYLSEAELPLVIDRLQTAVRAGYEGNLSIEAAGDLLSRDGAKCAELMKQAIAEAN